MKEKQKTVAVEMQLLSNNTEKEIIIHGSINGKHFEYIRLLKKVIPYSHIETRDGLLTSDHPFIGKCGGITKITEKETGNILYENTTLTFPESIWDDEKKFAHMNKMKEEKYGTDEYNIQTFQN